MKHLDIDDLASLQVSRDPRPEDFPSSSETDLS